MADCNPEKTVFMKFNYIPVFNVLLITDSLGLHKICILKKTSSNEHSLLFGLEEFLNMKFEWHDN